MTTTTEIAKRKLDIHVLNQRQYEGLEDVSNTSLYAVDPLFSGSKLLKTNSTGDIVESELTEADIEAAKNAIEGVQVNGTDLTPDSNKKVNIAPAAQSGSYGVVKFGSTASGLQVASGTGNIGIFAAKDTDLASPRTQASRPVVPANLDLAVKEGVTTNTMVLTSSEQTNACSWIGAQPAGNYALNADVVNMVDNATILLQNNTCYLGGTMTAFSVTCPTGSYPFTTEIVFTSGATATTIQWNSTIKWIDGSEDISQNVLVPAMNKTYTVEIWYDGTNFCGTAHGV